MLAGRESGLDSVPALTAQVSSVLWRREARKGENQQTLSNHCVPGPVSHVCHFTSSSRLKEADVPILQMRLSSEVESTTSRPGVWSLKLQSQYFRQRPRLLLPRQGQAVQLAGLINDSSCVRETGCTWLFRKNKCAYSICLPPRNSQAAGCRSEPLLFRTHRESMFLPSVLG